MRRLTMTEQLSFYCLHTPDHFGEILPDAHWFGTAIRAGWVFRGKEGWWLREGEGDRAVIMEVSNRVMVDRDDELLINDRLIGVGVVGEVTLFVGWEDV